MATSEAERAQFKVQVAEEEKQKLMLKVEKKHSEVSLALGEKAQLSGLLREKDILIESLQKQVANLKGEVS